MSTSYFFYGSLSHPPLLERVLGRMPEMKPAYLDGYEPRVARLGGADLPFPILVQVADGGTPGVVIETLSLEEDRRLSLYEDGFGLHGCEVTLEGMTGQLPARVFLPDGDRWEAGDAWHLEEWCECWGEIVVEAASDFLLSLRETSAPDTTARGPQIMLRAASRVRARDTAPETLRRKAEPGDVEIVSRRLPYARFFAVEDYALRHATFAGGMSETLDRAVFVSGDAAAILPYDPLRDRVLLIEQFRPGPMARGDVNPWLLEAIAGRIDPGETPLEAALREAGEEAGLHIRHAEATNGIYPSPGAKSEYVYCYLGIADLPDGVARAGGLESEGEDIRAHLIGFDRLMELLDTGELENGPLLNCILALLRRRPALRREVVAGLSTA